MCADDVRAVGGLEGCGKHLKVGMGSRVVAGPDGTGEDSEWPVIWTEGGSSGDILWDRWWVAEMGKWIFNNTNSAQSGLATVLLLPTASVAFQKRVPTSSAKMSEAQQRRGTTPWDTSFPGNGKMAWKRQYQQFPAHVGGEGTRPLAVSQGKKERAEEWKETCSCWGWEKQLVLGLH